MIKHILIVEDDQKIAVLLTRFLSENGFLISRAGSLSEARKVFNVFDFDLVLLDVMLPDGRGLTLINELKKQSAAPIIILSALGHVDDRVTGLENGATDYITKPFDPRELLLKIRIALNSLGAKKPRKEENDLIQLGGRHCNLDTGVISDDTGEIGVLTSQERKVMRLLNKNLGSALTRESISQQLDNVSERSVDTLINRLRAKIEIDPKNPKHVITERNKGYTLYS